VNLKLNIFTQTLYSTQQARYLGEFENQYFYFRALQDNVQMVERIDTKKLIFQPAGKVPAYHYLHKVLG
jgi:hypothetical protein